MSESEIEEMLQDCLDKYNDEPDIFTPWEQEFLETLKERQDWRHFSDNQLKKLDQIWENRVA